VQATLLIELRSEELPPKSLARLSRAFCEAVAADLKKDGFLAASSVARPFATPRRLAVSISDVLANSPDVARDVQGPPVGAAAQAIAGFAKKNGVAPEALEQRDTPKGRVYVARVVAAGSSIAATLARKVEDALKKLPIPKVMRWGDGDAQFVRPVHSLIMLHGSQVVPGTVLGLSSGNVTRGHRFMSSGEIAVANADGYEAALTSDGMVVPDFARRRDAIDSALRSEAERLGASLGESLGDYDNLLEEVTALVEHPSVYVGAFDAQFLTVPQECLILTMRQNQKYFPLFDAAGRLLPKFLIVSNMRIADASHIIEGNQRVVRPRLEDARFFYAQDRKSRLETRVPMLARVVYHNKLGSQLERTERIQLLAGKTARALGIDPMLAERAAWLCKADLLTGMVGEFPELQGTMGRYYALHDGEPAPVADAIEGHYLPRYAGDRLPEGSVAAVLALSEKLDTLAGLFGIGQQPTGDKDPFGLRRAALGVVRILIEKNLALSIFELAGSAFEGFAGRIGDARADLQNFLFDRIRSYFLDKGYSANEVEAVLCMRPARADLIPSQLEAVRAFSSMPESASLAAANKRIANILKQADKVPPDFDQGRLVQPEEKALALAFAGIQPEFDVAFEARDYTSALRKLALLKGPVDAFFDKIMVMDKDLEVRANRIGFLGRMHATMNRVADLSKLAA